MRVLYLYSTFTTSIKSGLRNVKILKDSDKLLGKEAKEVSNGIGSIFIVKKNP